MAIAAAASALLGIGGTGSGLEKLTIRYEEDGPLNWTGSLEALFNPSELSISSSVTWEAKGSASMGVTAIVAQEFRKVAPQTLTIDLFFDTYESHAGKSTLGHLKAAVMPTSSLLSAPEAGNVTIYTDQIAQLARVNRELHRPPICKLVWGRFQIFSGVLTQLSRNFTMFMPDGMPVRATVSCTFTEHQTEASYGGWELHSADVPKRYTVRGNDSLHTIAASMYNDPGLWRHIARANQISNPRTLKPGTVLIIPTIR